MSALAPVQFRKSDKRGCCIAAPAAMRRTHKFPRCCTCRCRSGDSVSQSITRTTMRANKLRIVSLKTRLVATFCCVLALSVVARGSRPLGLARKPSHFVRTATEVSDMSDDEDHGFLRMDDLLTRDAGVEGSACAPKMSPWNAFAATFFNTKIIFFAFALFFAMFAMFVDFSGHDPRFGENLFNDQGASMWLRLAFVVPGLTVTISGLAIAGYRCYNRNQMNEKEYNDWTAKSHLGEKKGKFWLLGVNFGLLAVLGLTFLLLGASDHDNAMLWGTVITMMCIGVVGCSLTILGALIKFKAAQQQSLVDMDGGSLSTLPAIDAEFQDGEVSEEQRDTNTRRRRLEEILARV